MQLPALLLFSWLPLLLHFLPTSALPLLPTPSRIVLFGDSLSDNGNGSYTLTAHAWPADPAYFRGRFSNGPTWVEYVAREYYGEPLDRNLEDGAHGGATIDDERVQGRTGMNSTIPVPGVFTQIERFLAKGAPASDALYVVSGGSNDAFFALGTPLFASPERFAAQSAGLLLRGVERLRSQGARTFLLPLGPMLSSSPYALSAPASTRSQLARYSAALRLAVRAAVARYGAQRPDAQVVLFETSLDAHAHEFKNAESACLEGAYGEAPRRLCEEPDEYVYWDLYHPSTHAHALIAQQAVRALRAAGLPPPARAPQRHDGEQLRVQDASSRRTRQR